MSTRPLFAAEGFGKHFRERRVLKNASIWARPGRITVLLGRNGSGKTTLLRCAVGSMRAEHGVVHFDGDSTESPSLARMARRGLMYLPVEGALVRGRVLRSQLQTFAWRYGGDWQLAADRLGMGELLERTTEELSGGEARRGALATALTRKPRCLLIDEPFAGIAPRDSEMVRSALLLMAREGCAIVMTGHEVEILLRTADDVVWMAAGTTHGLGTPQEARGHDQFCREYLGPRARRQRD